MAEAGYRLLGALLAVRRGLVALTAVLGATAWLLVLRDLVVAPSVEGLVALIGIPTSLGFAAWRLFELPPGALFRPAAATGDPPPQRTARCYASAYFDGTRLTAWRLHVRASLTIEVDGSLALASPPPILAAPEDARAAFPSRGQPTLAQLRAGERPRYPEWVYQPETLVGGPSRLVYQSAAEYASAIGKLYIPRGALADIVPGWQYVGLTRWPALRIEYHGPDGVAAAYLAFTERAHRAWALAALVGRGTDR